MKVSVGMVESVFDQMNGMDEDGRLVIDVSDCVCHEYGRKIANLWIWLSGRSDVATKMEGDELVAIFGEENGSRRRFLFKQLTENMDKGEFELSIPSNMGSDCVDPIAATRVAIQQWRKMNDLVKVKTKMVDGKMMVKVGG